MNPAFFKREYTCPICQTKFTSLSVRSSSTYVEEKETDFHVIYKGISPLHYSIIVCPICEYAASNTSFSKALNGKLAEQLAVALSHLKSNDEINFCEERDLQTTLKAFQLAIRTAQLKKVSAAELSGLLLAAGWIAREMQYAELEKKYINEALKYYVEAFFSGNGSIGNLSDLQATYLIGELYRRCGEYKEAIHWFNKVISHKDIKLNPNIEKLAREQWALARDQAREAGTNEGESADDTQTVKENTAPVEAEPETKQDEQAKAANSTRCRRPIMQMPAGLYADQIEWLKNISNYGYANTKQLFTREQVLRSLIDAVMRKMGDTLPTQYTSEEELVNEILDILNN